MNRKEREKLEIATGKKSLTEAEVKRREAKNAQKKKEKREKAVVLTSSLLALALIITGIVWFNSRQIEVAKKEQGFPSEVPMPSKAETETMKNELILLETTMGNIYMELDIEAAPRTSRSIRELVKQGFYDGIIFHRVIDDFMIQTGGFSIEGPVDPGYSFRDEINPLAPGLDLPDGEIQQLIEQGYLFDTLLPSISLDYGVLAMANAGPNTNSSQFFIITKKDGTDWLGGRHTGFGRVAKGMEVAENIQKALTDEQDKPLQDIIIIKASVVERSVLEE